MKNFCKDCVHSTVPNTIKEKFNNFASTTFLECPSEDEKVVGCLIKNIDIKWLDFFVFLRENKQLEEIEINSLKNSGWEI